jgi:hypothetical protein
VDTSARIAERLVGLALAGSVALNYPLLYLFSGAGTVFGIPAFYFYLFAVWAILIGLMAVIMRPRASPGRGATGDPPHD